MYTRFFNKDSWYLGFDEALETGHFISQCLQLVLLLLVTLHHGHLSFHRLVDCELFVNMDLPLRHQGYISTSFSEYNPVQQCQSNTLALV